MDDRQDDAILNAARAGDEAALEELLARHQPRIYRFSMKMCRDHEDAEDVLQDTLLAMARGLRQFRGASSVSTWLFTIARSFCIKKRRRSKFAPVADLSLASDDAKGAREAPDPGRGPDALLEDQRLGQALDHAIAALDPGHREVLVLRDVEGLTAPEVAEVMSLSVEAVKSRLHRARAQVRQAMAPVLGRAAFARATPACPDIVNLFSRRLEGEISADVCADMERHLASCGRCHEACESLKRTLGLCSSVPLPQVPADLQETIRASIRSLISRKSRGS